MDEGDGGDRNEAISAVADEGFLGEEDDDYEDLYNDVNVGEGFLQSLRRNEDVGFRSGEADRKVELAAESTGVFIPGVQGSTAGGGESKFEQDFGAPAPVSVTRVLARLDGIKNSGFIGNELASKGSGPVSAAAAAVASAAGVGGGGMRIDLGPSSGKMVETKGQHVNNSMPSQGMTQQSQVVGSGNVANEGYPRQPGGGVGGVGGNANFSAGSGSASGGGGTILFVGDLHWWTTDAELEAELSKYGAVKEVRFFDEKASGKSKGYCQAEFYDSAAATACKEGMNGHAFNARPCVVAFASPYSVRRMGEAQVNKNQQMTQTSVAPGRRGVGDVGGRSGGNAIATGGNYQGGDGSRNYGRGNWGRGGAQGMGNRGQVGPMRNRMGGMGGRGIIGNGGNGFGQGLATNPPLLPPQTMMNQGFDPGYGAHMGRMGGYGGFPTPPTAPFSGMLPSFPQVGGVGLPGVAPHVNPAFFGRGMPANGMGMMPNTVVEGHGMGMWSDPNAAGWAGDEHGGRTGESSYGDDAASDHQYGEGSHDRGGWPNAMKEKERVFERDYAMKEKERTFERDWSGASDRRYRDDREPGSDRDIPRDKDMGHDLDWPERRHREDRETGRERDRDRERDRERERDRDHNRDDRDRYLDHHRYKERESEHDDEWDRGRSSRTHSKSRLSQEEHQRSRSRDAEYGKRRRLHSE